MGMDTIDMLLSKANSRDFRYQLEKQKGKYYEIAEEAARELHGFRELPLENGVIAKLSMWGSVQMSAMNPKKTDRIAEMLINGSTEGIIEITKYINNAQGVSSVSEHVANRLIGIERENIKLMQNYL